MTAGVHGYTAAFRFILTDFDYDPWHTFEWQNWQVLDGVLKNFVNINNIQGVWANSTVYTAGQKAVDATDASIWEVEVSHTSASSPTTFAEDRVAHPTYWKSVTFGAQYAGAWVTAHSYVKGDVVYASQTFAIAVDDHTSGSTFSGDSAHWTTIADFNTPLDAAQASADAAAGSASDASGFADAAAASAASIALPLPVASGGTHLTAGVSGGLLAYTATNVLASSALLTAGNPIIGGGAGVVPSSGTRSGNTTEFATVSGALTNGHVVAIDGNGNLVDGGTPVSSAIGLHSTLTATNAASDLTWTGLDPTKDYELTFDNLLPATSNDHFLVQFGTGATPTWVTSGYTSIPILNAGGTMVSTQNTTASGIEIDFAKGVGTGTGKTGLSGKLRIGNMSCAGSMPTQCGGHAESNSLLGNPSAGLVAGFIPGDTTAKTAIRIFNNTSGHFIASGSASLYEVSK